jgi:acetoacetyl-CoA synthetase
MVKSGVQEGDVIAAVMSNSVDTMVFCLAALSIGAIWSAASCEMGVEAIVDRYFQVKPKIIFADDGYVYAGKLNKLEDRIKQWSQVLGGKIDSLVNVVVIPYCKLPIEYSKVYRGISFEQFLKRDGGEELKFQFFPFTQPAFILYSSGTVSNLALSLIPWAGLSQH